MDTCPWTLSVSQSSQKLDENCSLLGTDDVRGQISEHIFEPNEDYYLFTVIIEDKTRIPDHDKLNTSFSFHRELFWKITVHGL